MPNEYRNRRGQTYYLHTGTTKTGKPRHYLATSVRGPLAGAVPTGFEIYEDPNGNVFLRRTHPKLISDEEMEIIGRELRRFEHLKDSRLDRKSKVLTVYVADHTGEFFDQLQAMAGWRRRDLMEELKERLQSFSPMFQFVLEDKERRIFQARRYCYLGSVDDWIDVGEPGTLSALAKRYIKHLGQDSYYDLI